ncbi:MAG: DEAD/DEAH box helicase [Bradymonadaceae bacterium]
MTTQPTPDPIEPLGPTALAPFANSPADALETIFGFDQFRTGQREVVDRLLDGDDCLAVMPTGSGKSLCYQMTAALTQGVTLVVSPLIALMKDQIDALQATGLPVTEINSSMSRATQQERIERMRLGDYKIVYIAPERFRSQSCTFSKASFLCDT